MGAQYFTISPESPFENSLEMLDSFPDRAIILVFQHIPLYISENSNAYTMSPDSLEKMGDGDKYFRMQLKSEGGERRLSL